MLVLPYWPYAMEYYGHYGNMADWPYVYYGHKHIVHGCLWIQKTKTNAFSGKRSHRKHLGPKYSRFKNFGQNMAEFPL